MERSPSGLGRLRRGYTSVQDGLGIYFFECGLYYLDTFRISVKYQFHPAAPHMSSASLRTEPPQPLTYLPPMYFLLIHF